MTKYSPKVWKQPWSQTAARQKPVPLIFLLRSLSPAVRQVRPACTWSDPGSVPQVFGQLGCEGAGCRHASKALQCPFPGNIQDQVGQGSEQPDLVSGVPARCGGVGLDDL